MKHFLLYIQFVLVSVLGYAIESLGLVAKKRSVLPQHIADYELLDILRKPGDATNAFSVARYKNKKDQIVIVKMWQGGFKNFSYHTLKNEMIIYQQLTEVQKRLATKKPKKYKNISIPKLIFSRETKSSLLIAVQYVEGSDLRSVPSEARFDVYQKAVSYLRFLEKHMSQTERRKITRRTPQENIAIYPLVLLKAIMTHPKEAVIFMQGVPLFVRNIPVMLKSKTYILTHRDLHSNNILKHRGKVSIIDFEFAIDTDPMYEFINTLVCMWDDKVFCKKLLEKLVEENKNSTEYIRALIVKTVTHYLTDKRLTLQKERSFFQALSFAILNPKLSL